MQPIEKITEKDFHIMANILNEYKFYGKDTDFLKGFLKKVWNKTKANLFEIFGEELILKKEVIIENDEDFILEKIENLWNFYNPAYKFIDNFRDFIYDNYNSSKWSYTSEKDLSFPIKQYLYRLIDDDSLMTNKYHGESFSILNTKTNKEIKIQTGCKVSKILGKIAKEFDLEGYEEFRLEHSRILNEKSFVGTLCLSIHPNDFFTLSDNSNGWRSCLSLDDGEYRLGTTEMLNSESVVCAYLESSTEDYLGWNSKRWRELFIVDDFGIFGIKGYPYWNRKLEKTIMLWIKDLLTAKYPDKYNFTDFSYHEYGTPGDVISHEGKQYFVVTHFYTEYMYNDLSCAGDKAFIINKNKLDSIDPDPMIVKKDKNNENEIGIVYRHTYSGVAQCIKCGETAMETSFYDADGLECSSCSDYLVCCDCGEKIDPDMDSYYNIDGDIYCVDCVSRVASYCPCCEEYHYDENMYHVRIKYFAGEEEEEKEDYSSAYTGLYLCKDCIDSNYILDYFSDYNISNNEIIVKYEDITETGANLITDYVGYSSLERFLFAS